MSIRHSPLLRGCLVLVLLTGCANTTPAPITTVTVAITHTPGMTQTPEPTVTPSITPSPTLTPTPFPPTPEGAQGFDDIRNLATKTEDGTTYYYIPEINGWVTALNQNPIWLVDEKNSAQNISGGLPDGYKSMRVYYYRLPGAAQTFYSVEEPSDYASGISGNSIFVAEPNMFHTTQDYVAMTLARRFNNVEELDLTPDMLQDVLTKIGDHSLVLALDVPTVAKDNSQVTTKYWDPNKNIDFVQIPWESTNNDPSFFGRLSATYRWKLDVRGGMDEAEPGNLVVIYATSYTYRLHDWEEADMHLLGPIFAALISQQEPFLDYIAFSAADLNKFSGEFYSIYKPKGLSKEEEEKIWASSHYSEMVDFAYSASLPAALFDKYAKPPFLEYQCVHFDQAKQTIIYCYAPAPYLLKKANQQ